MKKYIGFCLLILALNGCDDGDVTVESFNFDTVTAQPCGNIVYKVKGNEALFMKLPTGTFANEVQLKTYAIGGGNEVRYRTYNGDVTSASICPDQIQPLFPVAVQEWIATSGTIEINSTAIYSTNALTGATRLEKYNHNIIFRPITFQKANGQQVYDVFNFGDYTTTATALPLAFNPEEAKICASGNAVYNIPASSRNEGLFLQNIDPALLDPTVLGTIKSGIIGSTTNKLTYRLLQTAVATSALADYGCSGSFPGTPEVSEEWIADSGLSGVSGIIEVVTTTNTPSTVLHTIRLKAVTFRKGNSTFFYGNDIIFAQIVAPI